MAYKFVVLFTFFLVYISTNVEADEVHLEVNLLSNALGDQDIDEDPSQSRGDEVHLEVSLSSDSDSSQKIKGDKDKRRPTRPQGDKDCRDENSTKGLPGPKGEKGMKGDVGPTGIPGQEGDKGMKGDRRSTGQAGPKGEKGEIGPKGEQGIQGPEGEISDEWIEAAQNLTDRLKLLESTVENLEEELTKPLRHRQDCNDVREEGYHENGVYNISLGGRIKEVYCDFTTEGGSWLVFQRRVDGQLSFYKTWSEYKEGFGQAAKEVWLGLESLCLLTNSRSYSLRVDMEDWEENTAFAKYSHFSVGDSSTNYLLTVSEYNGTAGDSMIQYNNLPFTTRDHDNDQWPGNCAEDQKGAWWYQACSYSNLNGMYLRGGQIHRSGIAWWSLRRNWYSMKRAEMKIRRN